MTYCYDNVRYLNTPLADHKIFAANDKNSVYMITEQDGEFIEQITFVTHGVTEVDLLEIVYDRLVQQQKQRNDGDIDMAIGEIDDALYRLKMKTSKDKLGDLDLTKLNNPFD